VSDMFFEGFGEDEDIIKENNAKEIEEIVEAIVGISLKGRRCICKAKRHDEVFEVAVTGSKGSFPFVALSNPYPIVCLLHVKPGEVLGILEPIEQLRDKRKRVTILDGDVVQLAIIYTEAETSIGLLDKKDWGTEGGLGGADKAFLEHFVNVLL
jgi:hypothetical protein